MIPGFDGGWLRTAIPTSTGHASAQREVGRLVLKPPPSVSTLAFRKSVLENAIRRGIVHGDIFQRIVRCTLESPVR